MSKSIDQFLDREALRCAPSTPEIVLADDRIDLIDVLVDPAPGHELLPAPRVDEKPLVVVADGVHGVASPRPGRRRGSSGHVPHILALRADWQAGTDLQATEYIVRSPNLVVVEPVDRRKSADRMSSAISLAPEATLG